MSKVAVVILNYKLKNDTLESVYSVLQSDYSGIEVIVVDNNSADGLGDELKKIKGVKFIQTGSNLGYTGGNNIGIKQALNDGNDFVFILNPDATVAKDTIRNLLDVAEKLNGDIVGPKILFNDKKTIWYAGGIIDRENVLGKHIGLDQLDKGQFDKVSETDFVTGAAILIRRQVFDRIGFFDERYFLYLEEVDFAFRAKKVGFKILYQPKAIVFHKNAQSTILGSPLQDYFISRNRLLFAFKFLSLRTKLALIRHIFSTIYIPTRRKALFDFLIGRFGKGSF